MQKRLVVGAGLPKIYKMLSEEKSYSERLFLYKKIDSLNFDQSRKAIEEIVSITKYNTGICGIYSKIR